MWQYRDVARVTRAESKERTRQRLLAEAQRLFRERGYAATSLEQIAEAAEVTKGAIYGHFASKEDLLLSAMEAAPTPGYVTTLNDQSQPLRERLAGFSRAVAAEDPGDAEDVAMILEFFAALLRAPDALQPLQQRTRAPASGASRRRQRPALGWEHGRPGLGHRPGAAGRPADLQAPGPRPRHAGGIRARVWPAGRPLPGAVGSGGLAGREPERGPTALIASASAKGALISAYLGRARSPPPGAVSSADAARLDRRRGRPQGNQDAARRPVRSPSCIAARRL